MITQEIDIFKKDIGTHKAIIQHAMDKVVWIANLYTEDYAKAIKGIDKALGIIERAMKQGNSQMLLKLDIGTIMVYKEMIYMYMRECFSDITKKDITSITSILEKLDEWVEEYMNTDGDMYSGAYIVENVGSSRHIRLLKE